MQQTLEQRIAALEQEIQILKFTVSNLLKNQPPAQITPYPQPFYPMTPIAPSTPNPYTQPVWITTPVTCSGTTK